MEKTRWTFAKRCPAVKQYLLFLIVLFGLLTLALVLGKEIDYALRYDIPIPADESGYTDVEGWGAIFSSMGNLLIQGSYLIFSGLAWLAGAIAVITAGVSFLTLRPRHTMCSRILLICSCVACLTEMWLLVCCAAALQVVFRGICYGYAVALAAAVLLGIYAIVHLFVAAKRDINRQADH